MKNYYLLNMKTFVENKQKPLFCDDTIYYTQTNCLSE